MKNTIKFFSLFSILFVWQIVSANARPVFESAELIDSVMTVVGSQVITRSELRVQKYLLEMENKKKKDEGDVLSYMVSQTLMAKKALERGFIAKGSEVENELKRIQAQPLDGRVFSDIPYSVGRR